MTVEQYLSTNPTREDAMKLICDQSNMHVMHVRELCIFKKLSEKFNFTENDFYDDQSMFTKYERTYIGLYNWKVKENNIPMSNYEKDLVIVSLHSSVRNAQELWCNEKSEDIKEQLNLEISILKNLLKFLEGGQ